MVLTLRSLVATETEFCWESTHACILSSYDPGAVPGRLPGTASAEDSAALAVPDREVAENKRVRCPIVRPGKASGEERLERVCILLHGLNERGWDKYRGWAQAIADKARCAVILFPIAFHMERSPASWGNFGLMRGVSKERIARHPGLRQSSMVNAAISERLDEDPGRFYLSGLMAARDLRDLVGALRSGELPGIASGAALGFFGYSIGAYLLQCLTLADASFASAGKRFLFCGGPFLSAMTPVSKYIMDSRAHERIIGFWIENLEAELDRDAGLAALVDTPEGSAYLAMVDPRHPQLRRRAAFSDGATRVASLLGDEVMPKAAILDFFAGTGVAPIFFDLPQSCTHIAPFNPLGGDAARAAFEELFDQAAAHVFG